MFPPSNLPKPTGDRPRPDEFRHRLQSAYLVMIRAYLRRKQAAVPPASPMQDSEVRDG